MKPADIHLLALDCEPVWLKQFLGQRHGYPANDTGDHFAKPFASPRTVLDPFSVRSCRPGLAIHSASAGTVTVETKVADAGREGRGTSHERREYP